MAAQSMWTPLSQQQPAMWPCSASVTGTGAQWAVTNCMPVLFYTPAK